ncbi:MAG TPA: CBS domain-containing protein [Actinomycetota bacterium]|jgi:CBS domain-containing protein|nr:CBS domain-containing protein [Actinomycetota bacterium]
MRVRSIYRPGVVVAAKDELLADAAARMHDHQVGSLAVLAGRQLVGIFTERDLARAIAWGSDPKATTVSEYMTIEPLSVQLDTDVHEVVMAMLELECRHLPVVEAGAVVGMVSIRDLLGATLRVA